MRLSIQHNVIINPCYFFGRRLLPPRKPRERRLQRRAWRRRRRVQLQKWQWNRKPKSPSRRASLQTKSFQSGKEFQSQHGRQPPTKRKTSLTVQPKSWWPRKSNQWSTEEQVWDFDLIERAWHWHLHWFRAFEATALRYPELDVGNVNRCVWLVLVQIGKLTLPYSVAYLTACCRWRGHTRAHGARLSDRKQLTVCVAADNWNLNLDILDVYEVLNLA